MRIYLVLLIFLSLHCFLIENVSEARKYVKRNGFEYKPLRRTMHKGNSQYGPLPRIARRAPPSNGLQGRIVGGFPAEPNEFPFAVWWVFKNNGLTKKFCGGSFSELYGIHFVITAAHCVWRGYPLWNSTIDRSKIKMYFGSLTLQNRTGVQVRRPHKMVCHHLYDMPHVSENDIALMFVNRAWEIEISPQCSPIEIAPAAFKTPATVILMGWGSAVENDGILQNELQNVHMRTQEKSTCQIYVFDITENQFCVVTRTVLERVGTCSGDSGGPVIGYGTHSAKPYLVGIVSYHVGNGCGQISVYTKVTKYSKWISDQVQIYKAEKPIEGRRGEGIWI